MRWRDHLHISYCTNVHPGEGLEALLRVSAEEVGEVRALLHHPKVSPQGLHPSPFGTGLRVGAEAAQALTAPRALSAFREHLIAHDLYAFTLNGFPYGDFAAPVVKESVYEPSWLEEERLQYTLRLARLLAELPGPRVRSISTVAGRFEPRGYAEMPHEVGQRLGAQLGALARGLAELEERTGVCVRVALEPEPGTTLERTADVVSFFERYVWPSEPLSARYVGLCYDTCHQAVMFETPREAWGRLKAAGVPVFKVQLSNAPQVELQGDPLKDQKSARALASFAEPRYLHQVSARWGEGSREGSHEASQVRLLDLPELFDERGALRPEREAWASAEAWRCHFHVPLWWEGDPARGLSTTQTHWREIARLISEELEERQAQGLDEAELERLTPHVEVETYSWGVMPEQERARLGSLASCVARELEVTLEALTSP